MPIPPSGGSMLDEKMTVTMCGHGYAQMMRKKHLPKRCVFEEFWEREWCRRTQEGGLCQIAQRDWRREAPYQGHVSLQQLGGDGIVPFSSMNTRLSACLDQESSSHPFASQTSRSHSFHCGLHRLGRRIPSKYHVRTFKTFNFYMFVDQRTFYVMPGNKSWMHIYLNVKQRIKVHITYDK